MPAFQDRSGHRVGRLAIISEASRGASGRIRWNCVCDCGTNCIVSANELGTGRTLSCGCLHRERTAETNNARAKHGHSRIGSDGKRLISPEYQSWRSMLDRCYRPKMIMYARYGGRGITVCDQWRGKEGFAQFFADMGHRPEGLTLDRENNNGNYEPGNCRWATAKEQNNNRIISPEGRAASRAALDAGRAKMWSDPEIRARLEADRKARPHLPNGDFAKSGA